MGTEDGVLLNLSDLVTRGLNRKGEGCTWHCDASSTALNLACLLPLPASWNARSWKCFLQEWSQQAVRKPKPMERSYEF